MKPTRLFFVRCNGDGSWLTQRRTPGGGHIFELAPRDPMLVSGPVGEWQGAYELIPSPWTVETWPQFQAAEPVRIYIHDGLVQHVNAPANQLVRIIDCDTEGTEASDTYSLTAEDRAGWPNGFDPNEDKRAFITGWINGEAVTKYAKFPCPNCRKLLTHIHQVHNCRAQPPFKKLVPAPFGGVAFDPDRRTDEDGGTTKRPTNGECASHGELILALSCIDETLVPKGTKKLARLRDYVNLTEAPEEALADLLTNLMHYCHREGIPWFNAEHGVIVTADLNFKAESGGAKI